MFLEIFGSVILGCALMLFGLRLIRSSSHTGNPNCKNVCDDLKKSKNFLCSSFGFGSSLIFLGCAIFASWELDDLIRDRLPDVFKYVSLNSFWSILWAGLGLTIILDDLKKRGNTESSPKEDANNEEKSNDSKKEKNTKSTPLLGNKNDESKQISANFFARLNPFNRFAKKEVTNPKDK